MNKIEEKFQAWSIEADVNRFIRQRLGLKDKEGKTSAEKIIDNAVKRAEVEEKPEWTPLLIRSIDEKKDKGTTINLITQIAESSNKNIDNLVDVTPKKKTIFEII